MADPFIITGPAVISFSGGRTSAYMLWRILQAHDGVWPTDVWVIFSNTGKEREETLRFIYECASRWGVNVLWVERRPKASDPWPFSVADSDCDKAIWWREAAARCGEAGYEVVGFNSASRLGEPFSALNRAKGFVPNRGAGFCSIELKGRTIRDAVRGEFGWKNWTSVIGLRYDEQDRVYGALNRNKSKKDPWRNAMPLNDGRITRRDVLTFWLGPTMDMAAGDRPQGFDLGLYDYEGNCDLCWKKSLTKRIRGVRDEPSRAEWWALEEAETDSTFDEANPIRRIADQVDASPMLPLYEEEDHDAECGSWC